MAISNAVKKQLVIEGVSEKKIRKINLCYDRSQYNNDIAGKENEIRTKFDCKLLLLYVARLVEMKRHVLAFEVVKRLADEGLDCKMICIGDGDHKDNLLQQIEMMKMNDKIFLQGWVSNVFDYIKASDIVMLLSASEASSHVVKEAAFCNRTVIVCKSVGDFEEIIHNGENGFLVDRERPITETVEILRNIYNDKSKLAMMSDNLLRAVQDQFSMEAVKPGYEELFSVLSEP